jgi:hypothetical protein
MQGAPSAMPPQTNPPIPASTQHSADEHVASRPGEWAYIILRYGLALFLLLYGFAKLTGAQFTILDSELDKRMGHVSGFWLTWYYFSFSKIYGTIIALVQIAGAVLLMFRRTTLLAAFLLLPVLANIVLIDVFYGIDLSGTLMAAILLVALLVLLAYHKNELIQLFWVRQNTVFPSAPGSFGQMITQWATRIVLILACATFAYWVANYNNRAPTPIDGVWHLIRVEPASSGEGLPATIFFERNRAHLCVFKYGEDHYRWHDFRLDSRAHAIEIWQDWQTKGANIFSGHYELYLDRLTLTGTLREGASATLVLERIQ